MQVSESTKGVWIEHLRRLIRYREGDPGVDFIQFLADTISAVFRHGLSLTTLIVALAALLRVRKVKRKLKKLVPMLSDDDSEVKEYVSNQARIESKVDLLLEERGLKWGAHSAQVSKSQDVTDGQKISLKPTWVMPVRARFIGAFTKLTGRLSRSKTRGESIQMKKFTSRKFILAVTGAILIVLNDGLDLGIDSETVIAFAGLLATWIVGESAVDAKRASGKNKIDEPGDTGPAV